MITDNLFLSLKKKKHFILTYCFLTENPITLHSFSLLPLRSDHWMFYNVLLFSFLFCRKELAAQTFSSEELEAIDANGIPKPKSQKGLDALTRDFHAAFHETTDVCCVHFTTGTRQKNISNHMFAGLNALLTRNGTLVKMILKAGGIWMTTLIITSLLVLNKNRYYRLCLKPHCRIPEVLYT